MQRSIKRYWPGVLLLFRCLFAEAAMPIVETRTALVIGNSSYRQSPLPNPAHDARAMAQTLGALGFQVTRLENGTLQQMLDALRGFGDQMHQGQGVALFYYAGHGVQMDGHNYLIPVDAILKQSHELRYSALDLAQVLNEMAYAGSRMNLVILDACRNNPFIHNTRSLSRGLAPVDAPAGTMIAFATAPGDVANDGEGDNGLYTESLLASITTPGLTVEQVFKHVRSRVMDQTKNAQVPWENSSLIGDFYFLPRDQAANQSPSVALTPNTSLPPQGPSRISTSELIFWESASHSNLPEDYLAYLQTYPHGAFAPLASMRVQRLRSQRSDAVVRTNPLGPLSRPETAIGPDPRIADLLRKARAAFADNRLTSPEEESVARWCGEVLAAVPNHPEAIELMRNTLDKYLAWASASLDRHQSAKARSYLDIAARLALFSSTAQQQEMEGLRQRLALVSLRPPSRVHQHADSPAKAPQRQRIKPLIESFVHDWKILWQ